MNDWTVLTQQGRFETTEKVRQDAEEDDYDSKTHELWQKIAVVNDFHRKKAEKSEKTAKFGGKIVHNRKKVP